MKRIDPRHLVQFHEIIRTGSFTRAAETLGLTQPALTRNMKVMEGRLGFEVLVRSRQRIVPTTIGLQILEEAASVVMAERRISQLTSALRQDDHHDLRIGCTPSAAFHLLPAPAAHFASQYPMTRLDVHSHPADSLARMLGNGEIEIMLAPTNIASQIAGGRYQHLFDTRMLIVASRDHPLAGRSRIDRADLQGQRWALPGRNTTSRLHADHLLQQIGIETNTPPAEIPVTMIHTFLQTGNFLSILPDYAVPSAHQSGQDAASRNIVELRIVTPEIGYAYGVAWNKDRPPSTTAARFIELFQMTLAR